MTALLSPDHLEQLASPEQREAEITSFPPPLESPPVQTGGLLLVREGLLKPEDLDMQVLGIKDYKPTYVDGTGFITYQEAEMSSGFYHRVITGIPREQKTKMMLEIGTPWWCDPEGFLEHFGRKVLDMGMAFRIIGSERYHVGLPLAHNVAKAFDYSWRNITLARSALSVLKIMDATDVGLGTDKGIANYVHIGQSFYFGASRPAMYEPAVQVLAPEHGRVLHWSEVVDPGVYDGLTFPPSVDLAKVRAEKEAICEVVSDVWENRRQWHYLHTFNRSPDSIIPQAATVRTLVSAASGKLDKLVPAEQQRLLSLYLLSLVMNEGYKENHQARNGASNTEQVDLVGAHLSIPKLWQILGQRFGVIIEELQSNDDNPELIDFERVKAFARQQAADMKAEAAAKAAA